MAKGVQSVADWIQSAAKGVQSVMDGVQSIAKGVHSVTDGVQSIAKGVHSVTDWIHSATDWIQFAAEWFASVTAKTRRFRKKMRLRPFFWEDLALSHVSMVEALLDGGQ
jgi:methyl-accepting chemotaxis protein